LFAIVGFIGSWMFFLTFYRQYPQLHFGFAVAAFFIPSVVFWGSGILKDTITLACLGISVYFTHRFFIQKVFRLRYLVILVASLALLYSIKIYIVLTFLPAALVWIFFSNLQQLRSSLLKVMLFPVVILVVGFLGYQSVDLAGKDNDKYSLNKIGQTAQITAYDIRYYTGRSAGSGYTLGVLDGSLGSMLKLAPQAINASLFRPYLWEVNNPLMLLSALESFAFLLVVIALIARYRMLIVVSLGDSTILFLFVFSITFAFAIGVSTFNFGTLVRYKIPLLPFFAVMLALIDDHANRLIKLRRFEAFE
jgi:hypothetical protein